MRVTFISAEWRLNGGVASYLQRLARVLVEGGHAVQVVHADPDAQTIAGIRDDYVPGATDYVQPRRQAEAAARQALDVIAAFEPDVVHVQACNNFTLEQRIRERYRATKTLHVYDYCPSNTKYHYALDRECVYPTSAMCLPRMGYLTCTPSRRPNVWLRMQRRARDANHNNAGYDRVIVASEHVRQQALATGYARDRVEMLPYFVAPAPQAIPEPRLIVTGGRLVREKGIDLFLAALAQVPRPWRVIIAGDGQEAAALTTLAGRFGLSDDVEFAGWQDEAGMSALYQRASLVVMPSRWPEPSGIIGLEAMAHGRPVVAFATGGIPEWLDHGRTGLLAAPLDVPALADSIAALLADPARAAAMGTAGRARAASVFAPGPHVDNLMAIYSRLPRPR